MEFGLYLHFPWCAGKCAYCDFYSMAAPDPALHLRTGRALLTETRRRLAEDPWAGGGLRSLYVGGGTPSLLPVGFFEELAADLVPRWVKGAELTVEMNPESLDPLLAYRLVESGFTRASLGAQSFEPERLALLGRRHSPTQTRRAVQYLREAGIPALGLDLITQTPGQTAIELERELQVLLELQPEHVSAYGLSWESGTPLSRRRDGGDLEELSQEAAAELYLHTSRRLRKEGYLHYEVSNFCRPGRASLHNTSYWEGRSVLGVGPGAVSTLFSATRGARRWKTLPDWRAFLDAVEGGDSPPSEEDLPDREARLLERVYLGLRWCGGLSPACLEEEFGRRRIDRLRRRAAGPGLAERFARGARGEAPDAWRLDPEDWLLLDEIAVELVR